MICTEIRRASALLKAAGALREVQLFGDRLNAVAVDASAGEAVIRGALEAAGIEISSLRVIPASWRTRSSP